MKKRNYSLDFSLLADYEWLARYCTEGLTVGYLNRPISNFFVGGSSYTKIRLKFMDSYRVKYTVLRESKVRSFISSVHAIGKTFIVMYVLYTVCCLSKRSGNSRQMRDEADKLTTEYYKHPKASG